jgi:hypothetical protein
MKRSFLKIIFIPFIYLSSLSMWNIFAQPNESSKDASQSVQPLQRAQMLELVSLGVTYEKFRQRNLIDALDKGSSFSSIRENDPSKFLWSEDDKSSQSGGRALDALENGGDHAPMYWGVPSIYGGSHDYRGLSAGKPIDGLVAGAETNGMAWHLFVTEDGMLSDRPDNLLEAAFKIFDKYPDLPLLFISCSDTTGVRDRKRAPGTPPLLRNGRYLPERPDSTAVFVLARRDRVDRMRAFAWNDKDNDFGQTKIRMAYYAVKESRPDRRLPTTEEWLAETFRLAQRSDIRYGWNQGLAAKWQPTPWFPVPWSREQLATFDSLPTLGYIHRPVFVKTTDDKGLPLPFGKQRNEALQQGWAAALAAAGEKSPTSAPQRIITATGDNTNQALSLHAMLQAYDAAGGPTYDITDGKRFIDTDRRLGNTGAATFFMQAAIGVMASYREGGVSAAINLRDTSEASIVLITPPSDELRKTQQHPKGGDVFRHKVTPAYDPADYQ